MTKRTPASAGRAASARPRDHTTTPTDCSPAPASPPATASGGKTCAACGETKPLSEFYQSPKWTCPRCKPCERENVRSRYWSDPERHRERQRARWRRDVEKSRAQRRARRLKNIEVERSRSRERAKTPDGRTRNRAAVARYAARHPERIAARNAATVAARSGTIPALIECQASGCDRRTRLERHHSDYSRPLETLTLCHLHHEATHHHGPVELKDGSFAIAPASSAVLEHTTPTIMDR